MTAKDLRAEELVDVLVPGAVFDTPFESGCVVTRGIDDFGGFIADDSDGVSCQFHPDMVTAVNGVRVNREVA